MLASDRARNGIEYDFTGPMILAQEMQQPHIGSQNSEIRSDRRLSNQDHNKSNHFEGIENKQLEISIISKFQDPYNSLVKEHQINKKKNQMNQEFPDYHFLMKSEFIKMSSLSLYQQYVDFQKNKLFSVKMNSVFIILCFSFHWIIFLYLPLMLSFNLSNIPLFLFIFIKCFEILVTLNNQLIEETDFCVLKTYINTLLIFDLVYLFGLILLIILFQNQAEQQINQCNWILLLIVLSCQQKRYYNLEKFVKNYCNWHSNTQLVVSFNFKIFLYINLLVCFWNHFIKSEISMNSYFLSMYDVISIISMNSTFIPVDTNQKYTSIIVMVCGIIIYVKVFRFFAFQFYCQDNLKGELDKYFKNNDHIDIKLKKQICNEVLGQQNWSNQIILSKLSQNTLKELLKQKRFSFLQDYFQEYSIDTLNKLVDCCEDIWCTTGQTIINKDILDDSSLYFIKEGQFTVQIQPKQILKTLNVGQTFGEYSFYSQQPRVATIVCKEQGHLFKLSRLSFLKCLNYNEKQLFCLSQDRLLYQNINPNNQKCYCCEANNHLIINCPKLTYKPSKLQVMRQMQPPHIQHRFDLVRKRKKRSKNAIRNSLEGQSIDVDLFYYMFCDKWNQQNSDNSCQSPQEVEQEQIQEQEYEFAQEILTESVQITQSVKGDVPNIQNQNQDSVPFTLQLSNVINSLQQKIFISIVKKEIKKQFNHQIAEQNYVKIINYNNKLQKLLIKRYLNLRNSKLNL